MATDYDSFTNYEGVEQDDAVFEIIKGYKNKGYLAIKDTLAQVRQFLGEEPVLTKVGAVKKERITPKGEKKIKTRIIVDSKQARTSKAARKTHKSNLPLVTNTVRATVGLMNNTGYHPVNAGIEYLIIDVTDAYWLIPLHVAERKFFVIKFRGKYLIFLRTAQGSKGAPLTWAAVMSLLSRCLQSLFMTKSQQQARLNVYVDDPILSIQGPKLLRRRIAVKTV